MIETSKKFLRDQILGRIESNAVYGVRHVHNEKSET